MRAVSDDQCRRVSHSKGVEAETMPGSSKPGPRAPWRLWTLSKERRRYSSGLPLVGLPLGVLFTTAGLLGMVVSVLGALSATGIIPWPETSPGQALWKTLLGCLGGLALGATLLLCGTALLWTLRTTFDRGRDLVVVRSGWLGLRCRRRRLSEFRAVTIRPHVGDLAWSAPEFDVALSDDRGACLVIGWVTLSSGLARKFAREIADFIHLPLDPNASDVGQGAPAGDASTS